MAGDWVPEPPRLGRFEALRRHLPKPLSTRLGSAVAGSAVPFPPFSLCFLPESMCRRVGPVGVIASLQSRHCQQPAFSLASLCRDGNNAQRPGWVRRAHRAARDSSCWGRRRAGWDLAVLLVSAGDPAGSAGGAARHSSGIHKPTPLALARVSKCRFATRPRAGPARQPSRVAEASDSSVLCKPDIPSPLIAVDETGLSSFVSVCGLETDGPG